MMCRLLLLLLQVIILITSQFNYGAYARALSGGDLAGDFLSLGGGGIISSSVVSKQQETLAKIIQDDVSGDFSLTEQIIKFLDDSLGQFAAREQIGQEMIATGQPIVQWAQKKNIVNLDSHIGNEMNYVFANYEKIKSLMMKIVTERPAKLGPNDLAFRCKQYDALKVLKELASKSSNFLMLVDVFAAELFSHCLIRKIAIIRSANLAPSSTVKQFVDIYREGNSSGSFNLQQAIAKNGPLESAANLVFDPKAMSLGSDNGSGSREMVARFKSECQQHGEQLKVIWDDMDEVANFLSSPMMNVSQFNLQMKFTAPQLVYASVCGQLAST